jgi:hypothetical protein
VRKIGQVGCLQWSSENFVLQWMWVDLREKVRAVWIGGGGSHHSSHHYSERRVGQAVYAELRHELVGQAATLAR